MSKAYIQGLNLSLHEFPSKSIVPVQVFNFDLAETQFSSLEDSVTPTDFNTGPLAPHFLP